MRLAKRRSRRGPGVRNVESRQPGGLIHHRGMRAKLNSAQKDQIAPGIQIGGLDVGGRSADSARKIIKNEIVAPLKQPVVVSFEGKDYTLSPKRLEQNADVEGMVDEAVEKSREGNLLERVSRYAIGSEVDTNLEPRVSYSEAAVDDFLAELAGKIDREAEDASITPSGDNLSPTPGHKGVEL